MQTSGIKEQEKKQGMSLVIKVIILFIAAVLLGIFIWRLFDYKIEKLKSVGIFSTKNTKQVNYQN
jgi:undecaprenyl pyrophosphate phosphatase UppP